MAKFFKKDKGIEISDISAVELFSLLKINASIMLSFMKDDKVINYIIINKHTSTGNINVVSISTILKENVILTYDKLLQLIADYSQVGILTVQVDKKDFQSKEPLFLSIGKIKTNIIETCVFIDYDLKKQIYTIANRPTGRKTNKIYYFELNDSILLFNENGPSLIYGKTSGIEDILF